MSEHHTLQHWAQQALSVQDACNLSGVAISFAKFMSWIRAAAPDRDTAWYNHHPIAVLFIDKMADLTGIPHVGYAGGPFAKAYDWCKCVQAGNARAAGAALPDYTL